MSFLTGSGSKATTLPVYLQSSLSGGQTSIDQLLSAALTGTPSGNITNALYPTYTGAVAADVPVSVPQAADAGTAAIPGIATAAGQAGGVQGTSLSALQSALTSQPQDISSYFTESMFAPAESTLLESTLPGIMSGSAGSVGGYQSTSESTSVDQAIKDMYSTLASNLGQTGYSTYQTNLSNQLKALENLSSVTAQPLSTLSAAQQGGVTGQTDLQAALTAQQLPYTQAATDTSNYVKNLIDYLNTQTRTAANQVVSAGGSTGALGSFLSNALTSGGSSSLASQWGTGVGNWISGLFGGGSSQWQGTQGGASP